MPATAKRPRKVEELSVEFVPSANVGPLVGILQLTRGKATGCYAVVELANDAPGRHFELAKVSGGSDDEAASYTCSLTYGGVTGECGCRGFLRHGRCRHLEGLGQLLHKGVI